MSYVAVYVLQSLSGVADGQVCVQDKLQSTGSLIVMKTILAGLKGQEAVLPEDRQAAKDHRQEGDRQTDRQTERQRDRQTDSWCEGYMSRGDILLTNERMENSIPYINLNSCRDTETRGEEESTHLMDV